MKKLLIVIPYYQLYPPMNGGMLRCFHILHQLCKYFDVTAIINQDSTEFLKSLASYPEIKSCRIISTQNAERRDLFSVFPSRLGNAFRFRYWKRTLKGPADINFLLFYPILTKLLRNESYDYIVLENLSSLNLAPVIRRQRSDSFILYDAHNVDTLLLKENTGPLYDRIKSVESSLYKDVDAVMTCSADDLDAFRKMNKGLLNGQVVPNGVEINSDAVASFQFPSKQLIFCGSMDYEPNREGLLWFCKKILPVVLSEVSSVRLVVIGKGEPGIELRKVLEHPAIDYYGQVESVREYYQKASVAIVPLQSGSGTRLKVLEAMSLSVPVVSTTKGAEGILYEKNSNICIADGDSEYAGMVLELLNDEKKAANIAEGGFALVKEKYDWNVIGKQLKAFLEHRFNYSSAL